MESSQSESGLYKYTQALIDPCLTWDTIAWIKSITRLPVIVKGVLTAEDALLAVEHEVDGILVSNHGARQLDGVLATVCNSITLCVYAYDYNVLSHMRILAHTYMGHPISDQFCKSFPCY